jgi:sensor histidine kinase YesM
MAKHLLRIGIIVLCFELYSVLGKELFSWARGLPYFVWAQERDMIILKLTEFIIISLLYPLSSYIIFHKFLRKNKYKTVLYSLLAVFALITLRYLIEEVLFFYLFGFRNYYANVSLLYYYVDNTYYALSYSGFGILYFFLQNDQRNKIERQQLQLANKQAQLLFLNSQINPHFLFNSLNNIYSLVYRQSKHSLQAILKLSDILRYTLYNKEEKVTLSLELDYIQKYIDLQVLRFQNNILIEKDIKGNIKDITIPPLILIPFVENAFKHGDFTCKGPHLHLNLEVINGHTNFCITNKKTKKNKDETGGIGISNVRQRLAYLYQGRHTLTIQEDQKKYTVFLQLKN